MAASRSRRRAWVGVPARRTSRTSAPAWPSTRNRYIVSYSLSRPNVLYVVAPARTPLPATAHLAPTPGLLISRPDASPTTHAFSQRRPRRSLPLARERERARFTFNVFASTRAAD